MPNIGHTWEFEDQTYWSHLPRDVTIEVWVENVSFSRYYPATWESPEEGGELEGYDIGDIYAYDGDVTIPLTKDQEKQIAEWAYGRSELEESIHRHDHDYSDDYSD